MDRINKKASHILISDNYKKFAKSKRSNSHFDFQLRNIQIPNSKRSQVTIFIIVAIIVVVGIILYFALRDKLGKAIMPKELLPVYEYFLSCIEDETQRASFLAGTQAGYLQIPEFEPGSEFAPFSSQLNFLSFPVPYWYYISGNGIVKEQVPSKTEIESQLNDYLEERIKTCSFRNFEAQGFFIEKSDDIVVSAKIKDNEIDVSVNMPLTISFGEITSTQRSHSVVVSSSLGRFYNAARKIYDSEQKNLFLENYAVDILRLYAPVDGVEFTCAPKIWIKQEVQQTLKQALEGNTQAIKIKGNYYSLVESENKYFVQDVGEEIGAQGESVNFIYSSGWPTKIEVYPEEETMMAEPVGIQEGLGVLGFCYVPYHFVYDISYPVLIQIYNAEEIFQFPVAVILQGNLPRKGLAEEAVNDAEPELCKYKIQDVNVYTYNTELNPVEANIGFECLGQKCNIGTTTLTEDGHDAYLSGKFPQCVNGFIIAKSEDYAKKTYQISTNEAGTANIILDKLYNLSVDLQVDGSTTKDYAIVSFTSPDNSQTIAWPSQKQIKLSEGQYDLNVYVYRESGITIPAMNKEYCSEVPKSGILGVFGLTEEKCFNINIPSQQLSNVISGGGKGQDYIIESQLEKGKIVINVESIPLPSSLDALQDSYNLLEVKPVYLDFE